MSHHGTLPGHRLFFKGLTSYKEIMSQVLGAFSEYLNFSCYTTACVVTCARELAATVASAARRGGGFGAHALLRTTSGSYV